MLNTLQPVIKAVILDMDGVLWRDDHAIGDLPAIFARLNELGLKVVLATNNSTRTVTQYQHKLAGFGVIVETWQIITSGEGVAHLLHKHFPQGGPVYVVGEPALEKTLADSGFPFSTENPIAVVAGLDRQLTYEKLRIANAFIRAGVPFFGTNPDKTFPAPDGIVPGAGTVLAAIETASGVAPVVAGKPFPIMLEAALERLGVPANQTIAIGDRLDTDILGGYNAGCRTALVLTGISTWEDLATFTPQPDLVAPSLADLL